MARAHDGRKRVLVTGGAGFIGSHLADALISDGHDVLSVDNDFTGTRRYIDRQQGHRRSERWRHDATFPLCVEVDEICNLAHPASPVRYRRDPFQTTRLTTRTSVRRAINIPALLGRSPTVQLDDGPEPTTADFRQPLETP